MRLKRSTIPLDYRVEEKCVQAEIALAEKVSGTQDLIARARKYLTNPWWTDAELSNGEWNVYARADGLHGWYDGMRKRFGRPVGSS